MICAHRAKLSGGGIAALMREKYGIELEMSGADYALAMTSVCDTEESFLRLADAIKDIDARAEEKEKPVAPFGGFGLPEQEMPLCDALERPGAFALPEEAAEAVSLEYVWAYPPGIPLVAPGEKLDAGLARQMAALTEAGVAVYSTGGRAPQYFYVKKEPERRRS
ncbi:hypothetical protein SDC9_180401 [bioreactor metagenome]|uniref:Arginine decarboxylase n=1 Tax=bioreactor metagenome TaxID=1076179 RepID=A0A645H1M4_9ZZZZ